jgi:hypothetical protein
VGQGGRRAARASGLLRETRDARAWAGARETGPWDAGRGWARKKKKGSDGPNWVVLGFLGRVWFSIFLDLFYFYYKQSLNSNQNLNSNHTQNNLNHAPA